ncbi:MULTISPECIES: hypothetical protein [Nonlabens]|uniref:Uncharacterized protein n=2 Tax=Nonlabens ulvanivorans TaxID=906888 RepID=A0A090Q8M7_NONUL|nr:hypothetical protein [Nonlabens ulvanivorans]GAK98537.1 hypothetical protein JCM19314_2568 [Nonlabens ulvanivorans]
MERTKGIKTRYYLTFLMIITVQLSSCQVIMDLETFAIYADDQEISIPDDVTYIKDVNNSLAPYIGTFIGVHNGNTITFTITKITGPFADIVADQLNIKYKIEDVNGNVLVQTFNFPDNSHDISGIYLDSQGQYIAYYHGFDATGFDECGQSGTFSLYINPLSSNQLDLYLANSMEILLQDDCPNGATPHVFPVNVVFSLTRI